MPEFKVADRVRWKRAVQWKMKDSVGTVIAVIPPVQGIEPTAYDVKFAFGSLRLYEHQIELDVESGGGK